ncbi:hypothetical protein RCL1_003969 [Eukaryota sp. TZLM3-RCL]
MSELSCTVFTPVQLPSGLEIPNRIVKSSVWEGATDENCNVLPSLVEIYENLAAGGTGLILLSATTVSSDGCLGHGQIGLFNDSHVDGVKQLVDTIHKHSAKVGIQLAHAGLMAKGNVGPLLGPSTVDIPHVPNDNVPMTEDQIYEVIQLFVEAAKRAETAGVDLIQLHAAHGYLINQFLSSAFNHRDDGYGGGVINRARFLMEIVESIKAVVSVPIGVKISGEDNIEGGNTIEDTVEICKLLAYCGVEFIEVSGGTGVSEAKVGVIRKGKFHHETEAYHLDYAKAIKSALKEEDLNVIISVVGGIRTVQGAQRCLEFVDMVSLGRPLVAEPDLPRKWLEDPECAAFCKNCSGCFRPIFQKEVIRCIQKK